MAELPDIASRYEDFALRELCKLARQVAIETQGALVADHMAVGVSARSVNDPATPHKHARFVRALYRFKQLVILFRGQTGPLAAMTEATSPAGRLFDMQRVLFLNKQALWELEQLAASSVFCG